MNKTNHFFQATKNSKQLDSQVLLVTKLASQYRLKLEYKSQAEMTYYDAEYKCTISMKLHFLKSSLALALPNFEVEL